MTAEREDKDQVFKLYKFLALKAGKHPYVANQRASGYVEALNIKALSRKYKKRCDVCGYSYGFFTKKCPKCGSKEYTKEAFVMPLTIDVELADKRYNPENKVLANIEREQFTKYIAKKALHTGKLITVLYFLLQGYNTVEIGKILHLTTVAITKRKQKLKELYHEYCAI